MNERTKTVLPLAPPAAPPLDPCRRPSRPGAGLRWCRTAAALAATLASAGAWGQDVQVYGTTLIQNMEQELPGFGLTTYRPVIQFLGVDATGLVTEGLSLHLYGWGRHDLSDQSRIEGTSTGELAFGYLEYRATTANAVTRLGRITVHQGTGSERLDGASTRFDLRGGFVLSAFGGMPVNYRTLDSLSQSEYDYQRDIIYGGRLAKRFARIGEVGLSFLQDGSLPATELAGHNQFDYTRRQMAGDLILTLGRFVDLKGRTVFDVASRLRAPEGTNTSRTAEHDYTLGLRFPGPLRLDASYAQRNYRAFYAGTNLPSLFNPFEPGRFRAEGLAATMGFAQGWEAVVDLKVTHRDSYGKSTRFGGELRRRTGESGFAYGAGLHRVIADDVPVSGVWITGYGLSYRELRAWLTYGKGRFSASLDGIHHAFDDGRNPNLGGRTSVYEIVGSAGCQVTPRLRLSGDLLFGITPRLKEENMVLVRADYRFPLAGGRK